MVDVVIGSISIVAGKAIGVLMNSCVLHPRRVA